MTAYARLVKCPKCDSWAIDREDERSCCSTHGPYPSPLGNGVAP